MKSRFLLQLNKFEKVIREGSMIPLEIQKDSASFWVSLKSKTGDVEGKLHLSKNGFDSLIIFEPGFPGDGSTRLERLWLSDLAKNGFDVFAVRHSGTIINGEYADNYLNCKERQIKAKEQGQKVLGGNPPHTIDDWLNEPFIALQALSKFYRNVFLAGHSFGGLAVLYSLVNFAEKYPSNAKKVRRLISLAGTTGIMRGNNDPVLERWREHIDTNEVRKRIKIGGAEQNIRYLSNAYDNVHRKIGPIVKNTQMIFVYVYGDEKNSVDEFIYPNEPLDILGSLNGNGVLVIDKSEKADNKTGRLAHDMDNFKSSTLFCLITEKLNKQVLVI